MASDISVDKLKNVAPDISTDKLKNVASLKADKPKDAASLRDLN